MAVRFVSSTKKYSGLSSDSKPVVGQVRDDGTLIEANDIPAGSTFLETDTSKIYRYDGVHWAYAEPSTLQEDLLAMLLLEVRALRERIEIVTS